MAQVDSTPELKQIAGFLGYYASKDGFIWTTRKRMGSRGTLYHVPNGKPPVKLIGSIRKKKTTPRGYHYVMIRDDAGNVHQLRVHRLVLLTFKGNPPQDNSQAAHENGNSLDNRIENLNWKSPKENSADRWRHGTIGNLRGEQVPHKVTGEQVKEIRRRYAQGGISQRLLGLEFGLNQGTVSEIIHRKLWTHIS